MTRRRCIVEGCRSYTRKGSRCDTHHHTLRLKYRAGWRTRSRVAIADYRTRHGDTCPGWRTPPHTIEPSEWTTDHEVGPLCRSCNARKRNVGDG